MTQPIDTPALPEWEGLWMTAPDGSRHKLILHDNGSDPRAEVRDSETGEVIFPAVKGPLKLILGDKP